MMKICKPLFWLLLLLQSGSVNALYIVSMEMEYLKQDATDPANIQFIPTTTNIYYELYDEIAPVNANNFIGYVNRGEYDNTFIHRKVTDFVLQGGGFSYVPQYDPYASFCKQFGTENLVKAGDPATSELGLRPIGEIYFVDADDNDIPDSDYIPGLDYTGLNYSSLTQGILDLLDPIKVDCVQVGDFYGVNQGLKKVPVDSASLPVTGEPLLSNTRGTIAMALFADANGVPQVDSATTQWFVNLVDNLVLDPGQPTGGFTVFGRVIGDGMSFFDDINSTAIINAFGSVVDPELGALPLMDYEAFSLVLDRNLIKVKRAREIVHVDKTDIDFGFVDSGMTSQIVVTVTAGSQLTSDLVISSVGDAETLESPYSVSTNCESATVSPGSSCTITIDFQPVTLSVFPDKLDIAFLNPAIPNITIDVFGYSVTNPTVAATPGDVVNFQFVFPGLSKVKTVTLTNNGLLPLSFSDFSIDNAAEFSVTDNCSVALNFGDSCELTVIFSPQDSGIELANLIISSNDPTSPYTIQLVGAGSGDVIPDIDTIASLSMGDTSANIQISESFDISNQGGTELTISSITLGGIDTSEFTITHNCDVIKVSEFCTINVAFLPSSLGVKSAKITINSDDPDETVLEIPVTASNSSDSDGVPDFAENAAPNNGDANIDGVPDASQGNVVPILGATGKDYITLATGETLAFNSVMLVDLSDLDVLPEKIEPVNGVFAYKLGNIPQSAGDLAVGIILPEDANVDTFYQYGPTPDNPAPHWYEFMYDEATGVGAEISKNAIFGNNSEGEIKRTFILVNYRDGEKGDNDLVKNGVLDVTATVVKTKFAASGGMTSLQFILLVFLTIMYCRARRV